MSEMPQRPREHVLGEETQDAFKSSLPTQWIYRPKQSDYGIDGEVELVSDQGDLTGRVFYVQLKGTDCDKLDGPLTVRLKIGTANYFRALNVPVLIVRFHAKTKGLFAVWFDQVERSLPKAGQRTVSVNLSEADELSDSRIAEIPRDLDGLRQVRSRLNLPVGLLLKRLEGSIPGMTIAEIAADLRSISDEGVVRFKNDGLITACLGPQTVEVLVGVAGKRSFPSGELICKGSTKIFAANLLTAIGLTLSSFGQKSIGASLISSAGSHGTLLSSFKYGIEAAFSLAEGHRTNEALQLAADMVSRDGYIRTAQLLASFPSLARANRTTQPLITELLERIAREAERFGDPLLSASARYNLGNFLQNTGRDREAFHAYYHALRADRSYAERPYFWGEIGASLFNCGHFSFACRCHERAIALGDRNCVPLLANAQLWCGDYDKALDSFSAYLKSNDKSRSGWILTAAFVRMVRDVAGIGKQTRDRRRGVQLAAPVNDAFEESQFHAAIKADGLCGLAWFNQASSEVKYGDYSNATKCFCAAALCQRGDLTAWCSAVLSAFNCSRWDLLSHVMSAAYDACGEDFSKALFESIRNHDEDYPKELLIDALGEILASLPKNESKVTVRLLPATH